MREQSQHRVPLLSRDLIKEFDDNFPAPTCEQIVELEPRKLAFIAGARMFIDTLKELLAADDADDEADKTRQGQLNV